MTATSSLQETLPDFLTAKQASDRFGISPAILLHWRTVGCCHLDGKKLRAQRQSVATHLNPRGGSPVRRKVWVYAAADLEKIAGPRGQVDESEFRDAAGIWLSLTLASGRYGVSQAYLHQVAIGRYRFRGEAVRVQRRKVRNVRNQHRTKLFVHEDDVRALAQGARMRRDSQYDDDTGSWLTEHAASERYDIGATTLRRLRRESGVVQVRTKRIELRSHGNRCRKTWVYREEDIERYLNGRKKCPPATHHDETGDYWSAKAAADATGVSLSALGEARRRGSSYLDGQRLRSKQVRLQGTGKAAPRIWVYYQDDVRAIARGRRAPATRLYKDAAGTWLTAALAEESYGRDYSTWHYWRTHPHAILNDKKIRAKKVTVCVGRQKVWVFHEDDLRAIAESHKEIVRTPAGRFSAGCGLVASPKAAGISEPIAAAKVSNSPTAAHANTGAAPSTTAAGAESELKRKKPKKSDHLWEFVAEAERAEPTLKDQAIANRYNKAHARGIADKRYLKATAQKIRRVRCERTRSECSG